LVIAPKPWHYFTFLYAKSKSVNWTRKGGLVPFALLTSIFGTKVYTVPENRHPKTASKTNCTQTDQAKPNFAKSGVAEIMKDQKD